MSFLIQRAHRLGIASHSAKRDELVVGIDLGTTNSAIAFIQDGKPRCIPNSEGYRTTPSVVTFLDDGQVVVGKEAKRLAAKLPLTTFSSVKRLIGRPFDDPVVKEEARRLPYGVGRDEEGAVTLECPGVSSVERGFLYPEEVSAQVLARLISDAEAFTSAPPGSIKKAIISVPAYFDAKQRQATMDAGQLAGLETVRILREPVAAALAYGLDLKRDSTVLVFDLGGGTYDVSILEVGNGTIEVLSTGGDPHLGGDDFDQLLVDWLKKETLASLSSNRKGQAPSGPDLDVKDPSFHANLRALAELAKTKLSVDESVTLRIPGAGPWAEGKRGPLLLEMSRDKFEELSNELWQRCRLPLDQACWNAGVDLDEVTGKLEEKRKDLVNRGVPAWKAATLKPQIRPKSRGELSTVILVGGATRMPAVTKFIRNMTGLTPLGYPDEEGPASKARDESLPVAEQKEGARARRFQSLKREGAGGQLQRGVNPDEAVALGAAVQAGVLQGQVKGLMVMDQWQASLMRALADMKLKSDPETKERLKAQFEMDDEEEGEGEGEGEEDQPQRPIKQKAINRKERRRREREGPVKEE